MKLTMEMAWILIFIGGCIVIAFTTPTGPSGNVRMERALLDNDTTAITSLCGPEGQALVYHNNIRNGMTDIRTTIHSDLIPYTHAQLIYDTESVNLGIHRHVSVKVLKVLISEYKLEVCDFWSPVKAVDDSFVKVDVAKKMGLPYIDDELLTFK